MAMRLWLTAKDGWSPIAISISSSKRPTGRSGRRSRRCSPGCTVWRRCRGRKSSARIAGSGCWRSMRWCRGCTGVFVELPMREALAPVYALLYRSAALLVLGLLLAVALGTMLARRLVVPIRRLQDGADRLGSGERSEPIEIHTGDEIELLAERFNQMAAKIQEAYETLEAKVEA